MGHGSSFGRITLVLTIGAGLAGPALLPSASASGQSSDEAGISAGSRASGAAGPTGARGPSGRAASNYERVEWTPQAKANDRAAIRDAEALFGRVRLPNGAARSPREPAKGGDRLATSEPPRLRAGEPNLVWRHRWWIVPGELEAVWEYIHAHPAAGSPYPVTGDQPRTFRSVQYSLQASVAQPYEHALLGRELTVKLVALPHDETGVLAEVEDLWLIPLSPAAGIPSRATVLEVEVAHHGETPGSPITVTEAAKVEAIRARIDRMPLEPDTAKCYGAPAGLEGAVRATFTFRATPAGAVVAVASVTAEHEEAGGPCEALTLTLPSRGRTVRLQEAAFIREAQTLLGVKLYVPPERHQ